jgi:hypothetical protein
VLIASLLAMTVVVALEVRPDDRVAVRWLPGASLPITCPFRLLTGLRCPGCGLTRAIVHLGRGEFAASWRSHWLGIPMGLALIVQPPYRLFVLYRKREPRISSRVQLVIGYGLLALMFGKWLIDVWSERKS